MGRLGNSKSKSRAKKPSDDVLLLYALMCISAADGVFEVAEEQMVRSYANTLPEFRDMDAAELRACFEQCVKIADKYKRDMKASLEVLEQIESDAVRKKAFVLAVDIAMSSGDVDENEEEMIEAMMPILRIDESLAQRTVEVLGLKYLE